MASASSLPRLGNGMTAAAIFAVATNQHLVRSLQEHDVAAHLAFFERGDRIEKSSNSPWLRKSQVTARCLATPVSMPTSSASWAMTR